MFSPTTFPCSAWYVTGALNVRECVMTGKTAYAGCYSTDMGFKYEAEMFPTRGAAVFNAIELLEAAQERHRTAGERLKKLKQTVERLKGGAA